MTNPIDKLRELSAEMREVSVLIGGNGLGYTSLRASADRIDNALLALATSGEAVAGHQNDRGEPDVIWLQCHGDDDPAYFPNDPVDVTSGEVSWCWEKIFEHDVKYIRADLAASEQKEADNARLREALSGTRDWFEAQAKSISKGNGSSWDLMQVREQRDLCDAALAEKEGCGHG